jgi:hypothetical protein
MSKGVSTGIAAALGIAALAIGAVPATAASDNHTEVGIPGTSNCHGQTIAAVGQRFGPGLSDAAESVGLNVKGAQGLVREVCAL